MRIKQRRLYRQGYPKEYLESDQDFWENNREAINSILEPDVTNKRKAMEVIRYHLNEIERIAIELIELEARKVLKQHSNLNEFIMGMGTAFFTDKNNNPIDKCNKKYLEFFFEDIIDTFEYGLDIRVKGNPMRFTANGPKITNW